MKKILVAADIATHPCTGGNNQCIMQYVACLRNIGFDVYYLLIGSNELSARSIEETKAFWGEHFFYYQLPWWQSCYMKVYKHITRQAYPDNIDFYSPLGIVGFVNRLHKKYNFTGIVVNYIWQSRLAHCIIPIKAIFTHDVFTYRNERIATGNNWHHHSAKEEARGVRRFPNILAIQDIERSYFSFLSPHSDVRSVYSNFTFVEQPVTGNKNILFFSGNNSLNLEAIKCFIDQVFMQLLSFDNEVRLLLGGNICSVFNQQELHPNIELKGRYENPDDFYLLGDIAINPVSKGTGLKIKTFEAIAHGKVTITNPHSALGIYNASDAPLHIAHFPDEYIQTILQFIHRPQEISRNQTLCRGYINSLNEYITAQYRSIFDPQST